MLLSNCLKLFLLLLSYNSLILGEKNDAVNELISNSIGIPSSVVPNIGNIGIPVLKSMYSLLTKEGRENALVIITQRQGSTKAKFEKHIEASKLLRDQIEQEIDALEKSLNANLSEEDSEYSYIKERVSLNNERLAKIIDKHDLFKSCLNTLEQHKEFLAMSIDLGQEVLAVDSSKSFYIEDIEVVEAQLVSQNAKISGLKLKKDKIQKQLASTQNRRLEKRREFERLEAEMKSLKREKVDKNLGVKKSTKTEFCLTRKQECHLLDLKKEICKFDEELCDFKYKALSAEGNLTDDEITIAEIKKRDLESKMHTMKQHLFITIQDVQKISTEIAHYKKKASKNKGKFSAALIEKQKLRTKVEEKIEAVELKIKDTQISSLTTSSKVSQHVDLMLNLIKLKKDLIGWESEILKLRFQEELEDAKEYALLFKLKNAQFYVGTKDQSFDLAELSKSILRDLETIASKIKEFETYLLLDSGIAHIPFEIADYRSTLTAIEKLASEQRLLTKDLKESFELLEEAVADLSLMLSSSSTNGYKGFWDECLEKYKGLQQKYQEIYNEVQEALGERYTWTRSIQAISINDLTTAWSSVKNLSYELLSSVDRTFRIQSLKSLIQEVNFSWIMFLLLFIFIIFTLFFLIKKTLFIFLRYTKEAKSFQSGGFFNSFIKILLSFLYSKFEIFYLWSSCLAIIKFQAIFNLRIINAPFEAIFYIITVPVFVKLLFDFLNILNLSLNWKGATSDSDWILFKLENFSKSEILLSAFFYGAVIILPLKSAAMVYQANFPSKLPQVLIAGYTLFAQILAFLFFSKDDWLSVIPEESSFFRWFKGFLNNYYYIIFFYVMTIMVLYNPYIGYYNLAYKILFMVPLSILIVYFVWLANELFRNIILSVFVIEEEDAIVERFENGRMLYGCIVIVSSLAILLFGGFIILKIWGMSYTIQQFAFLVKSKWVIPTGTGDTFGIIQIVEAFIIILSGFAVSGILNRFVINKLFDAFNAELGFQNTVHRIIQYVIFFISVIVALIIIGLYAYIPMTIGAFLLAIGIAIKDLLADIFGGIFILFERQFEIGHFIELDAHKVVGTVQKISFRSTIIRTARNFFVAVPNRIMIAKPVTNWGMMRFPIGAEITVNVNFDEDPKRICEIILKAIEQCPGMVKIQAPVVRLDGFFDSGMIFFARAFFSGKRVREMFNVCSDLRIAIIVELQKNGVKMPYPQRTLKFIDHKENINSGEGFVENCGTKSDEDSFIKINFIKSEGDK